MSVSIEEAWGVPEVSTEKIERKKIVEPQLSPRTPDRESADKSKTVQRTHRKSRDPSELLIREIRLLRDDMEKRAQQMTMAIVVCSVLVVIFMAMSWQSHQRMISQMSFALLTSRR
jgi:hypothetical protein